MSSSYLNAPNIVFAAASSLLAYLYWSDYKTFKTERPTLYNALKDLSSTDDAVRREAINQLENHYLEKSTSSFPRDDEKSHFLRRGVCIDFGGFERLSYALKTEKDQENIRKICRCLFYLLKSSGLLQQHLFFYKQ